VFVSKVRRKQLVHIPPAQSLIPAPKSYENIILIVLRVETVNSKLMFCRNTQQTFW
jgi:hypothetical protein